MPIYKLSCEFCGSSDAVTDYGEYTHCYSCNKHIYKNRDTKKLIEQKEDFDLKPVSAITPVNKDKCRVISERNISKQTAEFYGVWVNDNNEFVFPYYSRDGKTHIANQFKVEATKGFMIQGDINKSCLFGQQLFPAGSAKQITILEGAFDALAAYEMTGKEYPCVAIKSVSSALKEIQDNFQYLNSFETIVICFDNDKEHFRPDGSSYFPGQEAAQKVAARFELGKVRVLTLRKAKDANDYLMKGWDKEFVKEWWKAPVWSPLGLKLAKDMWDEVIRKDDNTTSVPYPWDGLNRLTYGIRLSEFVTITAFPGVGKTSTVREIVFNILQTILANKDDSRGIGLMMLEDSNKETLLGLMSLAANKPLHLPDVRDKVPDDELRKYFDAVYGNEKIVIWDHFGSNDITKVLDFVRYMHNLGCKYIVLDHLSIIVSDQSGDERKQLDEISTKLKTLCMELNIAVIAVVHQNRKGEIRGTMGIEQLSNIVIKLYRDLKSDDDEVRNLTKVTVEKNRFSGKTGPACLLKYDAEIGRLMELPQESLQEYLNNDKSKKISIDEDWD
jgi:twinkle protein